MVKVPKLWSPKYLTFRFAPMPSLTLAFRNSYANVNNTNQKRSRASWPNSFLSYLNEKGLIQKTDPDGERSELRAFT